jgi:hypothetical protein
MVVYNEALDSSFRLCYDLLRKNLFQLDNNNNNSHQSNVSNSPMSNYSNSDHQGEISSHKYRSLPLASLLPQLKMITNRFLPESVEAALTSEIKNISSGPLLDSLCLSIFDAEEEMEKEEEEGSVSKVEAFGSEF